MKKLLVLGAGPGGYTAAFYAADLGFEVTLIDSEDRLGGTCLLQGCIPSKALLHVARLIHETREAADWGLEFEPPALNLEKLRQWKNSVIGKLTGGLGQLNQQRNIRLITGRARFVDDSSVVVGDGDPIPFDHCIVATGSRPAVPPALRIESPRLMDSTGALELSDIPEKLLVVGGGYIGLEMGTVYSALGSAVTVVEMTPDLLPGVDRDLVRILQARLRKQFDRILTRVQLESLQVKGEQLEARFSGAGEAELFDRVLVSVGRVPNTGDLGLESTGVRLDDKGFVKVGPDFRTDTFSISAIGDVIGGAMLAHKASHEARWAVDALSGNASHAERKNTIPAVVFTDPEIAWCGLTETQASVDGISVEVVKFPWGASGRATTLGRNDGFTKLILEQDTGTVLGVGIVGVGAGELISEGVLAVNLGIKGADLAHTIHPHPTLSETLMEAGEVSTGHSTHVYRKPR